MKGRRKESTPFSNDEITAIFQQSNNHKTTKIFIQSEFLSLFFTPESWEMQLSSLEGLSKASFAAFSITHPYFKGDKNPFDFYNLDMY